MSLDWTKDSYSTWEVVERLETRINASLSGTAGGSKPSSGYLRITTASDGEIGGAVKAEEGVHMVIGDLNPVALDGATRSGQRVQMIVELLVVTRNNQDRSGESRIALEKHLDLQDAVINAFNDTPPAGVPSSQINHVGIIVRWIPGGDEVQKRKKIAPDHYISSLRLEVKFIQRQQVVRDTQFDTP